MPRPHTTAKHRLGYRPVLDALEDRCVLSTLWLSVFGGLPSYPTAEEQEFFAREMLTVSDVTLNEVTGLRALDLTGSFLLETPDDMTQAALETELSAIAGFKFVAPYEAGTSEAQRRVPPHVARREAVHGPFSYEAMLDAEANGKIPPHGGDVPDADPADVLTNNNAGSIGTGQFTQSETSVVAFGNTVVIGYNDSGSFATGNKFTGFSRSTDGGLTFTDGGTLPTNPGGDVGDPVIARHNASGTLYFSTLQFTGNGIQVFRSFDNGATWTLPTQGAPGNDGFQDKQWIEVDNNPGPGNGNVYLIVRDFGSGNGIYFYRSTDGGATFGPNNGTFIASGNQGAYVAVGTDHSVYAFWWAGSTLQMRRSTDQGLTFGAPVTVAAGLVGGTNGDLGLVGVNNGEVTTRTIRSNSFPHAVVNPVTGAIYVTYNTNPAGVDKGDIFFVQSTNNGATWSAPVKVNDDPTTTDQWMPTLAVSPDGTQLMFNYYSREVDLTTADGDPVNNQFRYFARVADISGATVTFNTPSFAVQAVNSKPEVGRDNVVNTTYMGDYNQTTATPGAFHIVWSDNRDLLPGGGGRSDPNVYYVRYSTAPSFFVTTTTPANGSTVGTFPTTYTVDFNAAYDAGTVQAADFQVNGIAANNVVLVDADTLQFTYAVTPAVEGLNAMTIAAGDVTGNGMLPIQAFSGTFRVDSVPLAITGTTPAAGSVLVLGPATQTIRVNFNEPVDPATVQLSDFGVNVGTVLSATPVMGNMSVDVVIGGLTVEGTLTLTINPGAFTDANGGPNPLGFTGNYILDYVTRAYPTPLSSVAPAGSLIYGPSTIPSGLINFAGDTDSFTINLDPGQTVSIVVTPTAPGLQPRVELFDPANNSLGFAQAPAPGQITGIQTRTVATGGVYTIQVNGAGVTTGTYTVRVILNAAFELEGLVVGATNNTAGTAQNIDGSFLNLDTTLAHATRGAATGTTDSSAGYTATAVTFGFTDIGATGTTILSNTDDSSATVNLPFSFNFYGTNFTQLFPSSNGLITFGTANSSFSNATLSANPTQAAIAPLWDDLYLFNATNDATLKFQVIGAVGSRQAILQWNKVNFFSSTGADTLTFQAILFEGSNQIRFNYLDLDSAGRSTQQATAGIKAVNPTNGQFVEIVNNAPPNALIGTGRSTVFAPAPATADFYSFSSTAGQRVTVALTNLATGNVDVQLIAPDGTTVLASGVGGATNLNEVISNFLIPATGTYFLRITGDSLVPYDVVVTEDAVFDTENNSTQATAQTLTGSQGALGHVQGGGGSLSDFETGQQGWTINNAIPGIGTGLWHLSTRRGGDANHSPVTSFYYGSEVSGNFDTGVRNAGAIVSPSFLVAAGANVSFKYFLDTEGGTTFDQARLQISNNGGASWTNLLGPLAESSVFTSATASLAGFVGQNVQIRFFFDTIDSILNGFEGWYVDDVQIGSASNDDWYNVTLAPGETVIEVETRTPADGPGQFVNTLNPKIQIFNAGGVDITPSVTILGDGRNEKFRAVGLTPGATYSVRVSAEGGTQGEYFAGVKALRTPTPTVLVDNINPLAFRVFGAGWSLDANPGSDSGGYGTNARSHAGNGTSATYAQWTYGQNFTAGTSYEFFVTWVASPANATNATYTIFDGATQIGTAVLNQQIAPNDVVVGGTTWERVFVYTPATSGYKTISVRLSGVANGRVIADALFDPPMDGPVADRLVARDGDDAVRAATQAPRGEAELLGGPVVPGLIEALPAPKVAPPVQAETLPAPLPVANPPKPTGNPGPLPAPRPAVSRPVFALIDGTPVERIERIVPVAPRVEPAPALDALVAGIPAPAVRRTDDVRPAAPAAIAPPLAGYLGLIDLFGGDDDDRI